MELVPGEGKWGVCYTCLAGCLALLCSNHLFPLAAMYPCPNHLFLLAASMKILGYLYWIAGLGQVSAGYSVYLLILGLGWVFCMFQ